MEPLTRRKFLKGTAAVSLGSLLGAIGPFVASPSEAQASPAAQTPLPDDVVIGNIREKWLALGGRQGFGAPLTPERPTPDGIGRYNHFERNRSIYWHPQTGACVVKGEIRERWAQLGWERSWLGYPISDEGDFPEGGRVSSFQRGQIYWWPDTGAIDLNEVVVHYTGLQYFDEMDWDQGSNSDEPYALLGVVSPTQTLSTRTKVYSDVDAKESRPDLLELYRGKPAGLAISVVLMEHDDSDPDRYKPFIDDGVKEGSKALVKLTAQIPYIGPVLAVGAGIALTAIGPKITKFLNDLLDLQDDKIGETTLVMTAKEMIVLAARTENSWFRGVGFKKETDHIRGGGASAKLAFGIVPA